jgi:NADH-quinone oxidoreductase subunit N
MSRLDLLALLPVLILVGGATTLLLAGAWWRRAQPLLAGGIATALLAALAAGLVPPPQAVIAGLFGAAGYARFFTILWSLLGACSLMLAWRFVTERRLGAGEYTSLVLYAVAGMALLSSAVNLLALFLALEAFTLAFYILIAVDRGNPRAAEAGLKYLVMGAVATGFMAFGIALIYAATGELALPGALLGLSASGGLQAWGLLGWGLLLSAIGFKISLVPFHLWTADVYQGAPAPVGVLLATGSKGAVVAVLVGLLTLSGAAWHDLSELIWLFAALTMLVGALSALGQRDLKRLIAYSSVTHMGTLLVGLLSQSPAGMTAVTFYLVAYSVTSLAAFAVIASLSDSRGEPSSFDDWRGLGYRHPLRGLALILALLSLAGLPATAGFVAKLALFRAALQAGLLGLVLIGVLVSVISFAFYLRVAMLVFERDCRAPQRHPGSALEHSVIAIGVSAILLLGLFPGPLLKLIGALFP